MINNPANKKQFWVSVIFVTVIFSVLGYFGILHHEMWLDETHHWLLAKDSSSLSEMIHNARYEGHPMLWNFMLFVLTRISANPFSMQILNLVISTLAVIIFLRYSPFSFLVKISIVFSYFIFYEYTDISRNYALAFLLMVIVCVMYEKRRKYFILFSFALALLAQTHLFAAVIAGGIFFLTLIEVMNVKGEKPMGIIYTGMFLVVLSFVLVIIEAHPPADHFLYDYDSDPYLSFKRIGKAFSVLFKGLFPIPDFTSDHPWNSNLVTGFSKNLAVIPAALAWIVPAILLSRKKAILIFFYSVSIILVAFIYFSPLIVASRHCGFFFLLLITSLWLAHYFPNTIPKENSRSDSFQKLAKKISLPILLAIFIIQTISGIYMYAKDWNRPFSNGEAVAEWIKTNSSPYETVVVSDHSSGPPVCAYLGRRVFYPENDSLGSFCKWNTKPFIISDEALMGRIHRLFLISGDLSLLLVLNHPLPEKYLRNNSPIQQLKRFDNALVKSEDYTIYKIKSE
jgi:hypothetical protein